MPKKISFVWVKECSVVLCTPESPWQHICKNGKLDNFDVIAKVLIKNVNFRVKADFDSSVIQESKLQTSPPAGEMGWPSMPSYTNTGIAALYN